MATKEKFEKILSSIEPYMPEKSECQDWKKTVRLMEETAKKLGVKETTLGELLMTGAIFTKRLREKKCSVENMSLFHDRLIAYAKMKEEKGE